MTLANVFLVYMLGAVLCAFGLRLSGLVAERPDELPPVACIGTVLCLFWPLTLLVAIFMLIFVRGKR